MLYTEKINNNKINKRIVMFLVMYKYFYTIHVLLKSADIQRFLYIDIEEQKVWIFSTLFVLYYL